MMANRGRFHLSGIWRKRIPQLFLTGALAFCAQQSIAVDLSDAPLFSTVVVPGNLALALSVEWPTATTPAYTSAYSASSAYLGYFDPVKCYSYVYNSTTPSNSYFTPYSYSSSGGHTCTSTASLPLWSGNFLNWMSMQTLDTFRWILTGGYRSTDSTTETILTKTYAGYDSSSVIPNKNISSAATTLTGATPLTWSTWNSRVRYLGTAVYFTSTGTSLTTWTGNGGTEYTDYNGQNNYVSSTITTTTTTTGKNGKTTTTTTTADNPAYAKAATIYRLFINVKVCDSGVRVEDNCVAYGSNYKPEGLLQKYAMKLRYSAFGYFNDSSTRDGGIMRARMKYIAPTRPVPGSSSVSNAAMEWDSSTGVMATNPDSTDATATVARAAEAGWTLSVSNSGVMNYLNKFGYSAQSYKSKDPVGELYYAVTRYFRNLGNVSSYSSLTGAGNASTAKTWLDGFPAITNWDDPIAYSCQKNFVLGIGDTYSWYDSNLPGSTLTNSSEPSVPSEVTSDTTVDVTKATSMVGTLEGYASTLGKSWNSSSRGNSMYIAGMAYDAHTKDIRSDLSGKQTINTYWLDVHENQYYEHKNQYWLAAKYGGFELPTGFSTYASTNTTTTIGDKAWCTSDDVLPFSGTTYAKSNGLSFSTDSSGSTDKRPDNYFPGNSPATMKSGLTSAFEKIVSEASTAASTSLSSSDNRETTSGNANYKVSYDPNTWTSTLKGQLVSYDADGTPTYEDVWNATTLLDARTASNRLIVTCCKIDGTGLPFTNTALTGASLISRTYYEAFDDIVGVSTTSQSIANYIAYLRGNTAYELTNGGPYRTRSHRLGDIVNAKLTAVGAPDSSYYEIYNPGYKTFKTTYASRPTVVYAGANDGMLHAFDGTVPSTSSTTCTSTLGTPTTACGKELFAYVPSFACGNATTATASGLASLGNPSSFTHHYFVDATPASADVDFYKTSNPTASTNDWRTILVGGLGKGGKGYYALDVSNPASWTSEDAVAGKLLWEFTHAHLGYSYGDPVIVKTPEFGWTVILPSGYNNDDGKAYLFFVNPRTGTLLKTVEMPDNVTTDPLNLAHVEAYVPNSANGTADALYGTDLQGNIWRVDLTATTRTSTTAASVSYDYTIVQLASLTDSEGTVQPITTRALIESDPSSGKRYVLVGTGQLLSDNDAAATQVQAFYAIIDGTDGYGDFYNTDSAISSASGTATVTHSGIALPTSIEFPVTRTVMAANTDLTTGIGSTTSVTKPMGWYFDLPADSDTGIAERVTVRPDAINGIVAFAGNLPNGDACSPAGTAHAYAVAFSDGVTALADGVTSIAFTTTLTDISFYKVNGKVYLYGGKGDGEVVSVDGSYAGSTTYKRLSWREVPTAD